MSTVKLKTTLFHRIGKTVNLPIVGEKTFDNEGLIEVTIQEAALLLEKAEIGLEEIAKSTKPSPTTSTSEEKGEEEEVRKSMLTLKKTQLEEMATELGIDASEWSHLNKSDLIDFLIKKESESSAEEN